MQDLLNPEKAAKRRHRDGYKDGDYTLHAKHPVMEFIECRSEADATVLLAQSHEFAWEPRAASIAADDERNLAAIQQHKSTDEEMKTCLADLKVLGRREYKAILKWRKQMRKLLSLDADESKAEDPEEAADAQGEVFNEQAVIEEIEQRAEEQSRAEKRLERKRRQKMARDRTRLQLNMTAPMDIAMDEDSSALLANDFSMGGAELAEQGDDGDYSSTIDGSEEGEKSDDEALFSSDYDSDQEMAAMREQEVDEMYADYLARKQDRDAKLKIQAERLAEPEFKGAAEDDGDDDSEMSGNEDDGSDASYTSSISSSDDSEAAGNDNQPMATSDSNSRESGAASLWFKNPVFEGMDLSEGEDTQATPAKTSVSTRRAGKKARQQQTQKQQQSEPKRSEDSDDSDNDYSAPAIDAQNLLSTAQAVDLAIKLVQDGGRNKRDLMDERGYNRYTFNDQDSNLPSWFVVDEGKHNRPQRPISKEAVQLLRQRQKEIDARPIKKVMEAKARKKYKANKKLESLRKKMNDMLEADGPDDPEAAGKLSQIDKTMRRSLMKAKKAEHKTKKLVVARGGNRALKGRPKGVKGRYKMVDSRMKKDQRDMKAKAKPKK
jgi:AdoMet-dependent rRNA methyltransferase SPB1